MKNHPSYYRYWGKSDRKYSSSSNWHLLPYHSLDVAACAFHLLDIFQPVTQNLCEYAEFPQELFKPWAVFFTATHDIGKFSYTFQNLIPDLAHHLHGSKLENRGYPERHDALGFILWKKIYSVNAMNG